MNYQVLFTYAATCDLEDLYDYIASTDSLEKADYVLDKVQQLILSFADNPTRGAYPEELLFVGLREYRQLYFKPYRIIYRIVAKDVYVMVIADGRRDMQTLLQRRLLQSF